MLKTLGKRILVNNLLEYFENTAKILSYEFLYLKRQNCKNFLILANLR